MNLLVNPVPVSTLRAVTGTFHLGYLRVEVQSTLS